MGIFNNRKFKYLLESIDLLNKKLKKFEVLNIKGYKIVFSNLDEKFDMDKTIAKHSLLGGNFYETKYTKIFEYSNFVEILLNRNKDIKININLDTRIVDIQCYKYKVNEAKDLFNNFYYAGVHIIEIDITGLTFNKDIVDCTNMFANLKWLKKINLGKDFKKLKLEETGNMFGKDESLEDIDIGNLDLSNVRSTGYMFYNCGSLKHVDFKDNKLLKVEIASAMFYCCNSLETIDNLVFGDKLINISYMFEGCEKLKELDLRSWDGHVERMQCAFRYCKNLEKLELGNLGYNGVVVISCAFEFCDKLKSLDIRRMNIDKVDRLDGLFCDCFSLEHVELCDLSNCKIKDISHMFEGCKIKEIDLSSMDKSYLEDCNSAFEGCVNLVSAKIGKIDSNGLRALYKMFFDCENLVYLDLDLDLNKLTNLSTLNMFVGCNKLKDSDIHDRVIAKYKESANKIKR